MFDKLIKNLPHEWQKFFFKFKETQWFNELDIFLSNSDFSKVLPAQKNILKAFTFVNPKDIKVIILGQDPYPNCNQATGLAFAVPVGEEIPPSLRNIFQEVKNDYKEVSTESNLEFWAKQGVLLLNVTLTVEEGKPNSHVHLPWWKLTTNILNELLNVNNVCALLMWGGFAQRVFKSLPKKPAFSLSASHPSPLSYHISFNNCQHFKKVNQYLKLRGVKTIIW